MRLPGREESIALLREAGCGEGVVVHCLRVAEVALRLVEGFRGQGHDVDLGLVEAGALLHDLGRCRTHGIMHGVVGGELAREMGLPEAVARIMERHIGAGIPCDEAGELGLPEGEYVPETVEEKIVAYADKLIEGGREVGFEEVVERFAGELGVDHPALERLRALHEEIAGCIGSGS